MHRHFVVLSSLCLCLGSAPVQALDLLSAYRQARTQDAAYLMAMAAADAAREAIPQARAGLLPAIGYTNSRAHNSTTQTSVNALLGTQTRDYDYLSKSEAITLRQPILRADRVIQYSQAEAQVAAAEATLEKETQALGIRLASAYFETLQAAERLEAILTQKSAYAGQQKLAERGFVAGETSRTDIDEARARFLTVAAQEIEARSALAQAERMLAAILGEPVRYTTLKKLQHDPPPDQTTGAKSLDDWLQIAETTNPNVQSLRHSLAAAQDEIKRNRAQHLPTADLVVAHSYSSSENNTSVGNTYRTDSVGVQVSIPLFSGGHTSSTVRQAIANRERTEQQLEGALRQLRVDVTLEFNALAQGEAQIHAYREAEAAARQLLLSTQKGVQAGIRHTVDVLNAEQQLATARVDLARARVGFVLAGLKLRAAAGILSEEDILRTNGLLLGL